MYVTPEWVALLTGFPNGMKSPASLYKETAEKHLKTPNGQKLHGEGKKQGEVPGLTDKSEE